MKLNQVKQAGFTLIELIVVIVILGILAATALPKFVNLSDDANKAAVKGVAGGLSSASSINAGGCAVSGNTAGVKCIPLSAATATCASVGTLLTPAMTLTATPGTMTNGTYYVAAATSLTTAGVECTLDLATSTTTKESATFVGIATGS